LALLAAIVIVLAVVLPNLVPSEGEALDAGSGLDQVSEMVVIILMSMGIGLIAWLLLRQVFSTKKGGSGFRPARGGGSLGLLLLLVIVAIVLIAIPPVMQNSSLIPGEQDNGPNGGEEPPPNTSDGTSNADTGLLASIIVLSVAVLILLLLRSLAKSGGSADIRAEVEMKREQEMSIISESIEEIRTGGDVREVILETYRRMLRLQAHPGASKSLTAHELARLLVDRRGWPSRPTEDLTLLFEEAKYSQHPLGERHRQSALDSLRSIEEWYNGGEPAGA
jgi:hypothetical protein